MGSDRSGSREALLACLTDPDPGVRAAAARALDRIEAAGGVPNTPEQFRQLTREQWVSRLRSLEGLRSEPCLKLALRALSHPELDVRLAALDLAAGFRDVRATPHLANLLADPSPMVRGHAAEALGALGDRRAAEPLRPLLDDPYPQVRARAAEALGLLGHLPAEAALASLAASPQAEVRQAAVEALGRLGITDRA